VFVQRTCNSGLQSSNACNVKPSQQTRTLMLVRAILALALATSSVCADTYSGTKRCASCLPLPSYAGCREAHRDEGRVGALLRAHARHPPWTTATGTQSLSEFTQLRPPTPCGPLAGTVLTSRL
jgi:hypothetical protein